VVIDSSDNLNFKVKISEHSSKEYCSWEEVEFLIKLIADRIQKSNKKYDVILGVTNGGIIPARRMARELDNNYIQPIPVRNKKLHREELPLFYETKNILLLMRYVILVIRFPRSLMH
jgi:uncharacterized protein